jgi:glycosyltransferase involved in cell wall biosynthesis
MDVLFIPKSNGNPYQTELARCLNEHHVYVMMENEEKFLPILRVIFSTGKPDILHLHWTHTLIKSRNAIERIIKGIRLISEILFLKIAGVRIIWTVHNMSGHDLEENKIENIIHRFFSKMCDAIIVHCEYAKQAVKLSFKIMESEKNKICVIPHGNYIASYKNDICREKARKILGFANDETVFGFFGNIRSYKGVFDLVNAFQKLKEPRIRLLLAGKPGSIDIENELQRITKADNRILLSLGFIPDNRIQIYLNSMDVVVLPFHKVLTSGTALLAMSYGKPVVAPNSGCLKEVLGDTGSFLYESNDTNSLIDAMKKSLREDLFKLGEHNFQLASKADWRFSAKQTAKVYRTILEM